uniref:GIY-YIG endonuclease n=1 Tax=Ramaria rubella TaxID=113071 RepID=UPI0022385457
NLIFTNSIKIKYNLCYVISFDIPFWYYLCLIAEEFNFQKKNFEKSINTSKLNSWRSLSKIDSCWSSYNNYSKQDLSNNSSVISSVDTVDPSIKSLALVYKKIVILDPFNNRSKIAEVAKGEKGVYVFEVIESKDIYVGSSVNLYNRVCSYFMPSILAKSDRRVLRYLNKYGFKEVTLTLLILLPSATWSQVIELEQKYIDFISPNLNVDLVAGGYNGYHTPMSPQALDKLRKFRGTTVYIYDTMTKSLIYLSDSKQWLYEKIGIHHITLNNCISNGNLYLNRFFFSLEVISEFPYETVISSKELELLINRVKEQYIPNQPASKHILAENLIKPELTRIFTSLNEMARCLKGDRGTIRSYLSGKKLNLYRNQWKFTIIDFKSVSQFGNEKAG